MLIFNDFFLYRMMYPPYLNHMTQPDTIVPDPANPQDWNRYSYTRNNPLRYTDPTGHKPIIDNDENGNPIVDPFWHSGNRHNDEDDDKEKGRTLGHNGWDWVPVVTDVRSIIRGVQIANVASQQSGFMDQQAALQHWYNNCYGQCHYADTPGYVAGNIVGGPMPDVPLVDSYSEGLGEATSGAVNLGIQAVIIKTAPVQTFARGGPEWHVGLETTKNMNIVHVGNHAQYGVHIAFGAIRPYAANLHIYIQEAFPFFRIWKP
jgi:hypothetical protein